jgi:hypothetical protein
MKEEILKLYSEGKSYNEIYKTLGCAKSTVSYHCGKDQKEKTRNRTNKKRSENPILRKTENFKSRILKNRCENFQMRIPSDFLPPDERSGPFLKSMKDATILFNHNDVLRKLGENPKCYLTGKNIDLSDVNSFAFDHIIPVSKGGDNSLENLGLTTKDANIAKGSLFVEDLLTLCIEILTYNGYEVSKK